MNYGVRLDFLNARVDAQDIAAGPFTPRAQLRRRRERAELEGHRSRGSASSWDLFGDGKTAVKASIGRYVVGESYTIARAVNPVQSTREQRHAHVGRRRPGVAYTGTYNPFDDCDLFNPTANTKRPGPGRVRCDQQPGCSDR